MKKVIYIILGIFALNMLFSCAQNELVKVEKYAAKLAKKEKKRKIEEGKREAKEFNKILRRQLKEKRKLKKLERIQNEYDEFLIEYRPLGASTSIPEVNDYFCSCDKIFAEMVSVNEVIDFIEVKIKKIIDEDGLEITEMVAINKNTGRFIKKQDALKTYATSGVVLANCLLKAKDLVMNSPKVLKALFNDLSKAFSIRKKLLKSVKALKMSVQVIPLIQRKIRNNTDALRQVKNN